MRQTIVYSHGFKSSSQSRKATQLAQYLRTHFPQCEYACPDLHFQPVQALAQLEACCREVPAEALSIVGSSLGGFYAVVLAEKLGCRAVLLNPSIRPFETLSRYLGEQANIYTGEKFEFSAAHITELKSLYAPHVTRPERYLLIAELGDELLDHRKTSAYLDSAKQILIDGGDHELTSFPQHIPALAKFCFSD
ncbi:MAG: YqiA/YcfP family alpha/beta fold hydrolase [Betaproteobacteria bacterium]